VHITLEQKPKHHCVCSTFADKKLLSMPNRLPFPSPPANADAECCQQRPDDDGGRLRNDFGAVERPVGRKYDGLYCRGCADRDIDVGDRTRRRVQRFMSPPLSFLCCRPKLSK